MEQRIKEFMSYLLIERKLSKNTSDAYKTDLSGYRKYIKSKNLEFESISNDNIIDYLWLRKQQGISTKSIARFLISIKSFYKFLMLEEYITIDPTINLSSPKLSFNIPEYLSFEEINLLMSQPATATLHGKRDKAILEILYATGMRISEIINIKKENINTKERFLKCLGKGQKERLVPFTKNALLILQHFLKAYNKNIIYYNQPYLFTSNRNTKFSRVGMWKIIKKYALQSQIFKNITPHTIRHSFATHLLKNNASLITVQKLLGHSNIATTQIYTHIDKEQIKEKHKKYHPRG